MENIFIKIIFLVLWALAAIGFFNAYKRIIYVSTRGLGRLLCYIWVIITAPIFAIHNIVLWIYNLWMPEDWEVGDDEYFDQEEDNNEK